ncbi:MAG: phosphorylase kinase, partial [Cyanobacteria bacterium P01_D01_bin.44]
LENVITHLQGDYGIKRYLGDSFWAADYKTKLSPETRTIDFSDDMSARDALLTEGEEAQWCIFDPIVSVIFGLKYQTTGDPTYLDQQVLYFNRALGQLTAEDSTFGGFKCPELYYLENGQYVPNDVTPLLWTQANLLLAFQHLDNSLRLTQD